MHATTPEIHEPASFSDVYGDRLTVTGGESIINLLPVYVSDHDTLILCFGKKEATALRDRLSALLEQLEEGE